MQNHQKRKIRLWSGCRRSRAARGLGSFLPPERRRSSRAAASRPFIVTLDEIPRRWQGPRPQLPIIFVTPRKSTS